MLADSALVMRAALGSKVSFLPAGRGSRATETVILPEVTLNRHCKIRRAVIVGGGLIGIDTCEALTLAGIQITVVVSFGVHLALLAMFGSKNFSEAPKRLKLTEVEFQRILDTLTDSLEILKTGKMKIK